ncbi:glycosyltransferase [Clostridium neonatale]|uniref:glycosyltransferase n=3 Tax=Clostridium neonatale TaxID=137838 RepID=UPI00291C1974|nr:glycosyltransferase [Clostridium neonatale]CAI3210457.1 putative Glycosyltransferase [Clostridium neonatale]CAI3648904.1 putative Glycosyltransferase [Clostridium neonatale]
MDDFEKKINKELDDIYRIIDEKNEEEACNKYYNLILELENVNFKNINKLYFECSMLLFNNYYYEDCVKFLSKAYNNGYNKRKIKEFLFINFIEPNKKEFEESFEKNILKYNVINNKLQIIPPSYENLKLEFIPISKNRYFIIDLDEDNFNEIIDFSFEELDRIPYYKNNDEFSDLLLIDDFNLDNAKKYIKNIDNRNIYYYSLNKLKKLSFFKIPYIIEEYLKNVIICTSLNAMKEYFRKNLDIYLPRIIHTLNYKNSRNIRKNIKNLLDCEHEFRLTTKGRNSDNILLSICIPTWNRGNLALESINSLLKLPYDSEIEFVVSDNGSTKYIDEYKKIRDINDSRIKYFRFDENMGAEANFTNVIKNANGKFTMLISDEDKVILKNLSHYMNLLKNNKQIALIRPSGTYQYCNLDNEYFIKGYGALKRIFVCTNYVSGVIYNRYLYLKNNLHKLHLKYGKNNGYIYYPHMFWDSIMSLKGDCVIDNLELVIEGGSVLEKQIEDGIKEGNKYIKDIICSDLNNLPSYQTYDCRILQHYDFIELINMLNIDSIEVIIYLYIKLCIKTNYLIYLIKDVYLEQGYDLNLIYDKILECCLDGINSLNVELIPEEKELIKSISMEHNNFYRNYKND